MPASRTVSSAPSTHERSAHSKRLTPPLRRLTSRDLYDSVQQDTAVIEIGMPVRERHDVARSAAGCAPRRNSVGESHEQTTP